MHCRNKALLEVLAGTGNPASTLLDIGTNQEHKSCHASRPKITGEGRGARIAAYCGKGA
jgi:hypothetical protein